jgi:hypothetical protein
VQIPVGHARPSRIEPSQGFPGSYIGEYEAFAAKRSDPLTNHTHTLPRLSRAKRRSFVRFFEDDVIIAHNREFLTPDEAATMPQWIVEGLANFLPDKKTSLSVVFLVARDPTVTLI